jgi:hypothetical protein
MINQKTFAKYAANPAAFRDDLIVDIDGSPRRFGAAMDHWQRNDFGSIDPALMFCNGRSSNGTNVKSRAYFERPRGHSKTTDLAVTCCWALAFANRPLRGYCYAGDRDQARLLRDAMATIIRLNPWLGSILSVEANRVTNKASGHPGEGGSLVIEASDVGSSYGILPDLIICDELTHWQGDGSLWHSLISSAAKRSNCLLVVISNAGFAESWQWSVREAARTDEQWIFSRLDGPQASWMTNSRLEEQRRMLPAIAYARLWLNVWSAGGGDALTPADIDAAFKLNLEPMTGNETGYCFVGGLDLGLTRDSSAFVILATPKGGTAGQIRLAHHKLWRPVLGKKVDLMEVERHILEIDKAYGLEQIAFDPWQAELLGQRLEADSNRKRRSQRAYRWSLPWMRAIPPTGANLRQLASLTIECFQDHRLQLFPCENLRNDLLKLRTEEKSYGFRLTSPRDGDGHGDSFSAFALALLITHDQAGRPTVIAGNSLTDTSSMESFASFQRRIEELQFEQELLSLPYDPQAPWKELMKQLRPTVPFRPLE